MSLVALDVCVFLFPPSDAPRRISARIVISLFAVALIASACGSDAVERRTPMARQTPEPGRTGLDAQGDLVAQGLTVDRGGRRVLDEVDLVAHRGRVLAA